MHNTNLENLDKSKVTLVCLQSKNQITLQNDQFAAHFQAAGQIRKVMKINYNKILQVLVFEQYEKKWKSFIEWENHESVQKAIKLFNQTMFEGCFVKVFLSQVKEVNIRSAESVQLDPSQSPIQFQLNENKFASVPISQTQQPFKIKSFELNSSNNNLMSQQQFNHLQQIQEQMKQLQKGQEQLLSLIQSIHQTQSVPVQNLKVQQEIVPQIQKQETEYNFELDSCSVQDSDYEEGEIVLPPVKNQTVEDPLIKKSDDFDFAQMVKMNLELFNEIKGNNQIEIEHRNLQSQAIDNRKNEIKYNSVPIQVGQKNEVDFKVVFVRWFDPKHVTMDMMYNIFSTFGNIERMIFFKKKSNLLLQYQHEQSGQFLIHNFSGVTFLSQRMKVFPSNYKEIFFRNNQLPQNTNDEEYYLGSYANFRYEGVPKFLVPPTQTVKVTNIKKEFCNSEYLSKLFCKFGDIDSLKVFTEKNNSNKSLVKYRKTESAILALAKMHNYDLNGRQQLSNKQFLIEKFKSSSLSKSDGC